MENKINLLIVDDDPSICETIRLIAENCGLTVNKALSASEFREKYSNVKPDLITLDLNLGQSDGIELLRELANMQSTAKIIIISGMDEKTINSTLLLGRSQHLNVIATEKKPIDLVHLKALFQAIGEEHTPITKKTLSQAIDKKDFILYYQPQISIPTGKLLGVEALIRWQVAEKTIFYPDSFIALAEESGLISPMTFWVNEEAIKQCADFQKRIGDIRMSLNLSAKLLPNLMLPDELLNVAKEFGLNPEKICVEITESAAMENPTAILDVLTRFRIKGFSVSIDDFGIGYSSLVELQRMPFNELKIDKSFVINLRKDTSEYIIVRSIINLAHDLDLKSVAEGVETASSYHLLKDLGCDIAQGYYIGHPMPADEFELWLNNNIDEAMSYQFPKEVEES